MLFAGRKRMKSAILLVIVTIGNGALAGCGHELFTDTNAGPGDRRIDRYYDEDSAVKMRETRRKTEDMGFGYPAGMFQQ
jgi:hypothetical protein